MKCNTLTWETAAPGGAEHVQSVPSSVERGTRSRGRPEESRALRSGHCSGAGPRPGHALAGTPTQHPAHSHGLLFAPQSPSPRGGKVASGGPSAPPARSLGPLLCHAATAAGVVAGADRGATGTAAAHPGRQPRGPLPVDLCRGPRADSLSGPPPPAAEAARLFPSPHEGPYSLEGTNHRTASR